METLVPSHLLHDISTIRRYGELSDRMTSSQCYKCLRVVFKHLSGQIIINLFPFMKNQLFGNGILNSMNTVIQKKSHFYEKKEDKEVNKDPDPDPA